MDMHFLCQECGKVSNNSRIQGLFQHTVWSFQPQHDSKIVFHHYKEYFETTGSNFRTTNVEHHEAVHHSLKIFERKKGLNQQKTKLGTPLHQQKSLLSISCYNVLLAGFVPHNELRIRKRKRTGFESSSGFGPSSSPVKKSALKNPLWVDSWI